MLRVEFMISVMTERTIPNRVRGKGDIVVWLNLKTIHSKESYVKTEFLKLEKQNEYKCKKS